ncbi:hypothetical protein RUM43_012351 [Polyplax serrata]|uniref:Uncharacterized protein n=1 Tax=Polyplax serrata TaxID=468196 RepID=A0AAN8NKJ5_POLSC
MNDLFARAREDREIVGSGAVQIRMTQENQKIKIAESGGRLSGCRSAEVTTELTQKKSRSRVCDEKNGMNKKRNSARTDKTMRKEDNELGGRTKDRTRSKILRNEPKRRPKKRRKH